MDDPSGDIGTTSQTESALARMPTGAKLFLILSAALLPLALIAMLAALQTNRIADTEARARLRVAAAESARALAIEIVGDMTALRVALNALDSDAEDAPSCARVHGVFGEQLANGARFVIADAKGNVLCGAHGMPAMPMALPGRAGTISARIVPDTGLVLAMIAPSRKITAKALFPAAALARIGQPSGFTAPYAATLLHDGDRLPLQELADQSALDRTEQLRVPLDLAGLDLEMVMRSAPITSPLIVAMLLPLLMWAAAAGIGWFVVDRLLIRPLRQLRGQVARYRPGTEIDPGEVRAVPAREIRELGETFRSISRTLVAHEAGLAEGLVRQTKLTREVHHRVKNNLQVISSLINFHSRAAKSAEASAAYASIQRRVDALAVVHRNHFAELEETRGLGLRSVIGDLASNIRATAPERASGLAISLDLDSYLTNQDAAIAVSFLITELVELAMTVQPDAHIRISLKPAPTPDKAVLRVSSPALIDGDRLETELAERYGRVMEGLSRQLRSRLHHDPLVGAYEIPITVSGLD